MVQIAKISKPTSNNKKNLHWPIQMVHSKDKKEIETENNPWFRLQKCQNPSSSLSNKNKFHYLPMLLLTMAPNPSCWGLAINFLATRRGSATALRLSFSGIFSLLQLGNLECKIWRRWNEFIRNAEERNWRSWEVKEGENKQVGCQKGLDGLKYDMKGLNLMEDLGVCFGLWDSLSPPFGLLCERNVILALSWLMRVPICSIWANFWLKYWLRYLKV